MAKRSKKRKLSSTHEREKEEDQATSECANVCDFTCPICLQLVVEPVLLPCKHELCRSCFECHITITSLQCPVCRTRVSVWARKKAKDGTFVDQRRWELIQRLFPEQCRRRLLGEDIAEEDDCYVGPLHIIASEGEVREEYEQELKKVRLEYDDDLLATTELIKQLQQEDQAVEECTLKQEKEDELLARRLQEEFNKNNKSPVASCSTRGSRRVMGESSNVAVTSPKANAVQSSKLLDWLGGSPGRECSPNGQKENILQTMRSQSHSIDTEESDRQLALRLHKQINGKPKPALDILS